MKVRLILLVLAATAACGFSGGDPAAKQRARCERWDFMKNFRAGQTALYRFGGQLYEIPAPYFGGGPTLAPKDLTEDSDVASLSMFWPTPDDALMLPPHTQRDFACYGGYEHRLTISLRPGDRTESERQHGFKSLAVSNALLDGDVHGPCGGPRYYIDQGRITSDNPAIEEIAKGIRESNSKYAEQLIEDMRDKCGYTGEIEWLSPADWRALWREVGEIYGLKALTPFPPDEPGGTLNEAFGYLEEDEEGLINTGIQCSDRVAIEGVPGDPHCTMHFYRKGASIVVHFEAEHLPDWRRIKAGIIRTLDCFRANALREEPAATCTYDRDYYAAHEKQRLETLRAQDRRDLERMRGDHR